MPDPQAANQALEKLAATGSWRSNDALPLSVITGAASGLAMAFYYRHEARKYLLLQ